MATLSGDDFECISYVQESMRLDTDYVKALLERLANEGKIKPEEYMAAFKTTNSEYVTTKRKDPSLKQKWEMPKLGENITPEALVDFLGVTREKLANLKKDEGFYKEAVRVRGKLFKDTPSASTAASPFSDEDD